MMIIYGTWSVEVLESVEDSSHGAETWRREDGADVGAPHSIDSSSSRTEIDFLSWFSPTEFSDEEWGFA